MNYYENQERVPYEDSRREMVVLPLRGGRREAFSRRGDVFRRRGDAPRRRGDAPRRKEHGNMKFWWLF
jgi:hypothetical protein